MTERMTAAERREYYSAEATARRSRAANDLIRAAWELAGANGIKVPIAKLENELLPAPNPLMDWDE